MYVGRELRENNFTRFNLHPSVLSSVQQIEAETLVWLCIIGLEDAFKR